MSKLVRGKRKKRKSSDRQGASLRTISLLKHLAEGEADPTLGQLAQRLDLPQSTVHRLLQRLLGADLVERGQAQTYRPGRELFRIASLLTQKIDFPKVARPFLQELWAEWGETSSFCLYKPSTRTAIVVDTIRSEHPLQYLIERNAEFPLPWGALGQSILSHLPGDEIDAVLANAGRGPLSGQPLPSRPKMRAEFERVRQRGCAIYCDRALLNLAGVAAPVFGADRAILGCIGVTMPATRFDLDAVDELCNAVILRGRRLSAVFGGDAKSPG